MSTSWGVEDNHQCNFSIKLLEVISSSSSYVYGKQFDKKYFILSKIWSLEIENPIWEDIWVEPNHWSNTKAINEQFGTKSYNPLEVIADTLSAGS